MRTSNCVLSAALVLSCLAVSSAEAASRHVQREQQQEARIAQGVASGTLTRAEAHRLQHGQHRVDVAQAMAGADGVVNRAEKVRIERLQDRQSLRIARQKHDRQHRHR